MSRLVATVGSSKCREKKERGRDSGAFGRPAAEAERVFARGRERGRGEGEKEEEGEEGCLSLPEIHAQILRSRAYRITAQDLEGRPFEQQMTAAEQCRERELDRLFLAEHDLADFRADTLVQIF